MQYLGGKSRLAKQLAPHIDKALESTQGRYWEPFVGGFNLVPALARAKNILCSDQDAALITLYRSLKEGWQPPKELSEQRYKQLRAAANDNEPATAFAKYGCSFGGKVWGGYARSARNDKNYAQFAARSLERKREHIARAEFVCGDYQLVAALLTAPTTIYADPPYVSGVGYGLSFDQEAFERWCEHMAAQGHQVLVSGCERPGHWSVLWQAPIRQRIARGTSSKQRVEILYHVP